MGGDLVIEGNPSLSTGTIDALIADGQIAAADNAP